MGTGDGDFWGSKGSGKPSSPGGGGAAGGGGGGEFWGNAAEKKREMLTPPDPVKQRERRAGRVKRILGWSALTLVVLAGGVVALAPTIAGSLAPGMAPGFIKDKLPGTVSLGKAELSWLGDQVLTGVTLREPSKDGTGKVIARDVSIRIPAGLLGVLTGGRDFGRVTIDVPEIALVRGSDGVTNLERALGLAKPETKKTDAKKADTKKAAEPAKLPEGLAAEVRLKIGRVTYVDSSRSEKSPSGAGEPLRVALQEIDLALDVATGKALNAKLSAVAVAGEPLKSVPKASEPLPEGAGRIGVSAKVESWSDAAGSITPAKAKVDVTADVAGVPTAVLDALAGLDGRLAQTLGPRLTVNVVAKGSMKEAQASVNASAERLKLSAPIAVASGVLSASGPIELSLAPEGLRPWLPAEVLSGTSADGSPAAVTLRELPGVSVKVESLRVELPAEGKAFDPRMASAMVELRTTAAGGQVRLAPGGGAQTLAVEEFVAKVDASKLAEGVSLWFGTRAFVDGKPAGALTGDVRAAGVIDGKGQFVAGVPKDVQAKVDLVALPTALAQPFLGALREKLDLARDVGPTLNFTARANTVAETTPGAKAGQPPTLDASINLRGDHVAISGALRVATDAITLQPERGGGEFRDAGMVVVFLRGSGLASKFVPESAGYRLRPDSVAGVTITELNVPRTKEGGLALENAQIRGGVSAQKWSLESLAKDRPAVDVDVAGVQFTMVGTDVPKAELTFVAKTQGQPFSAMGSFDLPGLRAALAKQGKGESIGVMDIRPAGSVEVSDVPTSLASLLPRDAQGPDMGAAIRQTLGPTVSMTLRATPQGETAQAATIDFDLSVRSEGLKVATGGVVSPSKAELRATTIDARLVPAAVNALLPEPAPGEPAMTLREASRVEVRSPAVTIPLKAGYEPDLASAPPIPFTVRVPGRLVVDGVQTRDAQGRVTMISPAGIENFQLTGGLPVGALVKTAGGSAQEASVRLAGSLLAAGRRLAQLSGEASVVMAGGAPAGAMRAKITLSQIDAATVDAIVEPILLDGRTPNVVFARGIGDGGEATLTVSAAQVRGWDQLASAALNAEVGLAAPRLSIQPPVKVTIAPDRIALGSPARINWAIDPAVVSEFLRPTDSAPGVNSQPGRGASGGGAGGGAPRLLAPVNLGVSLERLVLPRGNAAVPLDAGVEVTVPMLELESADGKAVKVTDLLFRTQAKPGEGTLPFALSAGSAQLAGQPQAGKVNVVGEIANMMREENGRTVFDPKSGVLTVKAEMPEIPSALIDALAKQGGMLVDLLGPSVNVQAQADRVPMGSLMGGDAGQAAGRVSAKSRSARSGVDVVGTVGGGVFRTEGDARITLTEITPELGRRLAKNTVVFQEMSKVQGLDTPMTITAVELSAPLADLAQDLNLPPELRERRRMERLNGRITIDPGTLWLASADLLGRLFKDKPVRPEGVQGKPIEPLVLDVRNGRVSFNVAGYNGNQPQLQRWKIFLDGAPAEVSGFVDLASKDVDIMLWVEFQSMGRSVVDGVFKGFSVVGGVLGAVTGQGDPKDKVDPKAPFPIRIRGKLGEPIVPVPDVETFVKEQINKATGGGKDQKGGGLLDGILGKPKAPATNPITPPAPTPPAPPSLPGLPK
ncbi:MAG: hypothetical protein SFY95_07120 [Planctomycetota bacterium]|nr:hypothetical protein [Planctomycetota bacterium]